MKNEDLMQIVAEVEQMLIEKQMPLSLEERKQIDRDVELVEKIEKAIIQKGAKLTDQEKQALCINFEKTLKLLDAFNCNFNRRTGDIAWWCYEGDLKAIIAGEKTWLPL